MDAARVERRARRAAECLRRQFNQQGKRAPLADRSNLDTGAVARLQPSVSWRGKSRPVIWLQKAEALAARLSMLLGSGLCDATDGAVEDATAQLPPCIQVRY